MPEDNDEDFTFKDSSGFILIGRKGKKPFVNPDSSSQDKASISDQHAPEEKDEEYDNNVEPPSYEEPVKAPVAEESIKDRIRRKVDEEIDSINMVTSPVNAITATNSQLCKNLEERTAEAERGIELHDPVQSSGIPGMPADGESLHYDNTYDNKFMSADKRKGSLLLDAYGSLTAFSRVVALAFGIGASVLLWDIIHPKHKTVMTHADSVAELVLVPGHGGIDTGAVSSDRRYLEKDANLYLAQQTCRELKKVISGLNIYLPRDSDEEVSFKQYTSWINKLAKGKKDKIIVLQLHQNVGNSPKMFFMYSNDGSLESYIKSAEFVKYIAKGIKEESGIDIEKKVYNMHSEEGLYSDEYIRGKGYYVYPLKHGSPYKNIVIELNGIDQKLGKAKLDKVAKGIASGIRDYIVDKKNGKLDNHIIE